MVSIEFGLAYLLRSAPCAECPDINFVLQSSAKELQLSQWWYQSRLNLTAVGATFWCVKN